MIEVTTDPSRKLVLAHMEGFLEPADVAKFAQDERAAAESMGLGSGEFLLLVDTANCMIQSQDVVAAFQHLIANASHKARRLAIIRQGSLTRMQTNRIISIRDDAAVFVTRAEAEAWLFA
ncbi:hypothetical protein [Sphingomonas montana]|uniref:hypothetical protein n=1 Tax=Sphingomonas montana TaxID=1843236 RepID=UPI00096BE6A6|nr:hypothetical protein [Sphingomonas montana]